MAVVLAEELSEEDQQLKSELDMLVERLTVCKWSLLDFASKPNNLDIGIRHKSVQKCPRSHQRFDQNLHFIYDRCTKTSQVP